MTEGFNIEDINKKFAELSDTLDAIKTQNALNIGDTSRMLNNFGTKLDTVSDYINSEEMLELIADLKHSITDKYSVVTVKFAELETSLKEIQNSGNEIVTLPQMRELFDVLSTNITVFSKQVMAQGDILNEITLRIDALRTDDTDKREIIKNINSIKFDLEKFNNGFESIILNVNNNFETMMQHVSKLDPTAEVLNMSNALNDVKSTSDTILSAVQIVDQKQNKLDSSLDEVISQNTKINANIKALAGQSDFDGLVRKVEGSIELMTTLKGALTDANEQSQRSLLVQLDKLSAVVTKILTEEDFEVFKSELSKLVYDVIETTNVMRGDLLDTTSEFKSLAKLMEDLDLKTSIESLRTLVDDTGRNVKNGFIDVIANAGIEPIKNNINILIEKVEQIKASVNENSDRNTGKTSEKIDNLFSLTDKVREMVTYLPDTIRQNYASSEEGQRAFVEQCIRDLSTISDKIKYLQDDVQSLTSPIKENLITDIKQLKEIVYDIKNLVTNNDEIISKITNLETIVGRIAGDYDVALHSVQENLMSYMSGIKEDCESADIKMNNFAFEFNSLKSELGKTFADFKDSSKGQNDKFNSVCNGISSRFDSVMNAIAAMSEQPLAINGIKEGFDEVQHTMQDLILAVSDVKVQLTTNKGASATIEPAAVSSIESNDILLKLEGKINKVRDQLSFMSTDFMENLYNRSEKILEDFEPVKKAVLSFVDVDFQNVASVLKDQMDAYKIGMEKLAEGINSEEARPILNNIFTGFGSLENRVNNMENAIKESLSNSLVEIKNMLNMAKPLMPSVAAINAENAEKAEFSFNSLEEILDSKLVELRNDVNEKFENIHKHLDEAVIPKFADIDTKQNEILSKIDNLNDKEQLDVIKNQLNELFDRISKVHDEVLNSKIATSAVTEERLSGLGDEEKSIIVDFTNNLSELANLVKHTSDNIDEKITRALSENNINVDFEGLKSDIAQMLSSVQTKATEITVQDNDGTPISNVQILLEEYKSQIVNEINSVKQAAWDFNNNEEISKDLKVISQKMDLIALNDDVKFEIDKSLQEIRNTVKDQQKFLNTINILETLASLEDINKMKGLEQLSKLSDIISVDKLNALNKLTLLDKLKNLDCLDELQKIPKISGMLEVQEQLKTVIANLDKKLNVFSKNYSTLDIFMEENKSEIDSLKNELGSVKTAIMKHVLNVFEQLSFVVEGEEIKDFVDEKAQEILSKNQAIMEAILNNDNITQEVKTIKHAVDSLNPLEYKDIEEDIKQIKELSSNVANTVTETIQNVTASVTNLPEAVQSQVEIMKQQINQLRVGSTEDDGTYSYSMQDVESDIARLRLALDDIKKVIESNSLKEITDYVNEIVQQVESMKFNINQDDIFKIKVDIEKMTSDIVSISSRTNKLLLASDESANALNTSMQSFRNTISDLYDGLKKLDYTEMTATLDNIKAQVEENSKQHNNTLDSVAKLTIWADSADEKLSDVSETLNKLKKAMPSNEAVLDELETKFAKQQQRIEALEEKLDELLAVSGDNGSSNVSKKLTDIDKQLTRLNRSIERLTSYVDEE
ncbi:hypothetical protein IJ843_08365 [bacterium]|nr:hypothetical protein [bacterium]